MQTPLQLDIWLQSYEEFVNAKNYIKQRKLNTAFANISKPILPTSDPFLLIMWHIACTVRRDCYLLICTVLCLTYILRHTCKLSNGWMFLQKNVLCSFGPTTWLKWLFCGIQHVIWCADLFCGQTILLFAHS